MAKPIFKTKTGRLTFYSFACGYQETWEKDESNRLSFWYETPVFHVNGFIDGLQVWETIGHYEGIKAARKLFSDMKKWTREKAIQNRKSRNVL